MITRSFGGILFIDEAYGLYKEDSRDYGSEVIEMLVKFMDNTQNKDFVDLVTEKNVHDTIADIKRDSPVLSALYEAGNIDIVGAIYDVGSGTVKFL